MSECFKVESVCFTIVAVDQKLRELKMVSTLKCFDKGKKSFHSNIFALEIHAYWDFEGNISAIQSTEASSLNIQYVHEDL